MKLPFVVLLNAVFVAAGIFAYDRLREPDAPAPTVDDAGATLRALDARLTALEARYTPPVLHGTTSDADLLARLADLERQFASGRTRLGEVGVTSDVTPPVPEVPASPMGKAGEPGAEQVAQFRKLEAAARRAERVKYTHRRVDKVLDELGLSLSDSQRDQVVEAYVAFEPRRREIWAEQKASASESSSPADWERVIADTQGVIRGELTERFSVFLHPGDARQIAGSLGGK